MTPDVPSSSTSPAPPPGLIPPLPPTPAPPPVPHVPAAAAAAPAPAPAPLPVPAGYTHARGLTVSPKAVAWLPAVLLTITLFCSFFPWVASYLGASPVYSQNPWQAMFGYVSRNFALEEKASVPNAWLGMLRNDWEMLLPALLCLVLGVCLLWADRGLHALDPRNIPPLAKLWAWRKLIIVALVTISFTLLVIQASRGFGMQRAIRQAVREDPVLAKEREEARGSESKLEAVEYKEDQALAKYNLERTTWLYLGLLCNLLALLVMLAHIGLDQRGNKPPPRIVIQY